MNDEAQQFHSPEVEGVDCWLTGCLFHGEDESLESTAVGVEAGPCAVHHGVQGEGEFALRSSAIRTTMRQLTRKSNLLALVHKH